MYDDVKHVIELSSSITGGWNGVCNEGCGAPRQRYDYSCIEEQINHLIQAHGYKLLHVGQQTDTGGEGNYLSTVAILGSSEIPPARPALDLDLLA